MLVKNSIYSKTFLITLFIKQNNYHRYGVLLHTLKVMYGAFKDKNYKFIAPALLHDIGKPFVAYQKPSDKIMNIYSFTNHEEKSYQIIKNWFFLSNWTKDIVRYHFILRDMQRIKEIDNVEKYKNLEKRYLRLTKKFILDLHTFQKYDDFGKK